MSSNNVVLGRGSGSRIGAGGTPIAQKRLNTSKNVLLKVVILGNGGVGKSCLMNRFVSNHFDQHSFHTIGVEFLNKDLEINGETYTLQVKLVLTYVFSPTFVCNWDIILNNCFSKTLRFGIRPDRSVLRVCEHHFIEDQMCAF